MSPNVSLVIIITNVVIAIIAFLVFQTKLRTYMRHAYAQGLPPPSPWTVLTFIIFVLAAGRACEIAAQWLGEYVFNVLLATK